MRVGRTSTVLGGLLAIALTWAAYAQVHSAWVYGAAANAAAASDSLPLYLGARAVNQGLDPTQVENLQAVYATADARVTKALFSVLYPPSMHVMLQPIAGLTHHGFLFYWRQALLLLTILGLAAAGTAGVPLRRWPVAVPAAVAGGMALFPFFVDSQLALGQANLAIAGCFGLAVGCAAWGRGRLVGAIVAVGTAAKLVPAIILWPLVWGRRYRALGAALLVGVVLLGFTLIFVPIDRVVANVFNTLAFQRAVEPHWLQDPSLPDWGRFVGYLKRPPLTLLSLALVGWTQWRHQADPPRQNMSLALGIALLGAALGADGSGAAAPYATLAMPAAVLLLCGPLTGDRSRLCLLVSPMAGAVLFLLPGGIDAPIHDVEVRLVAACTVIWLGVSLRLVNLARPWGRWPMGAGIGLLCLALGYTALYTWRPPYGGPKTLPDAAPGSMTTPSAPPVAPIPQ
jgi:hypothetical protein